MPALGLGKAAPDPIGFLDRHCILPALTLHGTHLAHGLRAYLPSFSLFLAFLGTRGKEEVGVVSAT